MADLLPDRIKAEERLAVVGDLHGRHDLLAKLLARLDEYLAGGKRWLVFVGDFMDRCIPAQGSPRELLQLVLDTRARLGKVTACMGNHDLALVAALGLVGTPPVNNWDYRYFKDYNASVTFWSYGVPKESKEEFDTRAFCVENHPEEHRAQRREILDKLREAMPEEHKKFLASLPWCVAHPHFIIVHAGLVPDRPYSEQIDQLRQRDFSLNRPPWLCERHHLGIPIDCPEAVAVVSGHVRKPKVDPQARHILLDTCNGYGNVLSAVLLPERQVITT